MHPPRSGPGALLRILGDVAYMIANATIAIEVGKVRNHPLNNITKVEAEYTVGMVVVTAAVREGSTAEEQRVQLVECLMLLGLGVSVQDALTDLTVTVQQVG